uniref:CC-NBS-LRR resistance protein MLA13 n=1 Tax=Oryza sativa subsp. japonica TaxID=39947 RepID=Q7EY38_ORYSJ|nr:putative CC-NBS-LRR resistance protein MLA13 [Oryza sativa Japonica Group]
MEIVTGAINTLLLKFAKLLVGEYKLQKGVKKEIESLQEEYVDVRELSYDIEDSIDTFMVSAGKDGHPVAKLFSFKGMIDRTNNLFKKVVAHHQIAREIKDIKKLLEDASKRRERYKIDDAVIARRSESIDPRLGAMYKKETELVGLDGPKNVLVKTLMEEDGKLRKHRDIISIVGFGGLGKTTIANALLHELRVKFDCHFFALVSNKSDIRNILKSILHQLDNKANIFEGLADFQLINKIREILQNKRVSWDVIKLALLDGDHGSKIITTTRKMAVAERVGGAVYELKPLSYDDSYKLLSKRVFDTEDRLWTWKYLDVDNMRKILSLSYYDLPPHLKTCLLYLSKYPEDAIIAKDILIWSWIAEGFITNEGEHGRSLQEIGENYFNELLNKSLIQPVDIGRICENDGQVHACQVHDMVLEFTNQLSAEEGFVAAMPLDSEKEGILVPSVQKKVRRLSYNYRDNDSFLHGTYYTTNTYATAEARESLSRVRSFTVFNSVKSIPPLMIFRVLRVLRLDDCSNLEDNHLNDLAKLHHLRFLRLGNISKLPECIGNLQVLQTLDIRDTRSVIQLPPSFVRLRQLVRLIAHKVSLADGLTLGNMTSLQELTCAGLTENLLQEAQKFAEPHTRSPGLYGLDFMQQVPCCLQRFMSSGPFYRGFPRWVNSSLSCLTILSINLNNYMEQEYLVTLAELPSLQFLRIFASNVVEVIDVERKKRRLIVHRGTCAFRCLQEFHFYCHRMCLSFEPRAMQELQRICLQFSVWETIDVYGEIDFGLVNLPSLRNIFVDLDRFETSGEEIQEAEAAIRKAANDHHNHPSLDFVSVYADLSRHVYTVVKGILRQD